MGISSKPGSCHLTDDLRAERESSVPESLTDSNLNIHEMTYDDRMVTDDDVLRLMSTIRADRHAVHDELSSPEGLLAAIGRLAPAADDAGDAVDPESMSAAIDLRDALRRVAAHVTDDDRMRAPSPTVDLATAVAVIDHWAAQSVPAPQLALQLGELTLAAEPEPTDLRSALAAIARRAVHLFGSGADRVGACRAPGCVLYFLRDRTRREWCSVGCGNRVRAARHYHRSRPETTLG
jgi:predicted RNA-binding Zn ribbon-like protein